MDPCSPVRALLYLFLFMFSVVLLGLTSYRISYTKSLSNGDFLTDRSHFYDPIIVELLVASCLGILFSLGLIAAIFSRKGTRKNKFLAEHVLMWPLWILLLVGAAIATSKWHHLRQCRGYFKQCRILQSVIAFSWICWGFLTFALIASLVQMFTNKQDTAPVHRGRDMEGTYPDTRATTTVNTVHQQPVNRTGVTGIANSVAPTAPSNVIA